MRSGYPSRAGWIVLTIVLGLTVMTRSAPGAEPAAVPTALPQATQTPPAIEPRVEEVLNRRLCRTLSS